MISTSYLKLYIHQIIKNTVVKLKNERLNTGRHTGNYGSFQAEEEQWRRTAAIAMQLQIHDEDMREQNQKLAELAERVNKKS